MLYVISWSKFIFPSDPFLNQNMSELLHINLNDQAFLAAGGLLLNVWRLI
jgi:hypothetical protein